MMGERRVDQSALFYEFSLERHVPRDHLLRSIDRFVDLEGVRAHLAPFYSAIVAIALAYSGCMRTRCAGWDRKICAVADALAAGRAWVRASGIGSS